MKKLYIRVNKNNQCRNKYYEILSILKGYVGILTADDTINYFSPKALDFWISASSPDWVFGTMPASPKLKNSEKITRC